MDVSPPTWTASLVYCTTTCTDFRGHRCPRAREAFATPLACFSRRVVPRRCPVSRKDLRAWVLESTCPLPLQEEMFTEEGNVDDFV